MLKLQNKVMKHEDEVKVGQIRGDNKGYLAIITHPLFELEDEKPLFNGIIIAEPDLDEDELSALYTPICAVTDFDSEVIIDEFPHIYDAKLVIEGSYTV